MDIFSLGGVILDLLQTVVDFWNDKVSLVFELLEQEKILAIHATVAEVKKYADGLRERGIQAKGFNERMILSILVYTLFSRMFDLMQPPAVKHSIAVV